MARYLLLSKSLRGRAMPPNDSADVSSSSQTRMLTQPLLSSSNLRAVWRYDGCFSFGLNRRTGKKKLKLKTGRIVSFKIMDLWNMPSHVHRTYGSEAPVSGSATAKPSHFCTRTTRCISDLLRCPTLAAVFGCVGRPPGTISGCFMPKEHMIALMLPVRTPTLKRSRSTCRSLTLPENTEMSRTDVRFSSTEPMMLPNDGCLSLSTFALWTLMMTYWPCRAVRVPRKVKGSFIIKVGQTHSSLSSGPLHLDL
mmetsp:Transcript_88135/g.269692  ORF Transcript_88135/g.269692 Transcript_88135/m.269692 type:complete len:252 (-) Transcript_88135:881-1636(-)